MGYFRKILPKNRHVLSEYLFELKNRNEYLTEHVCFHFHIVIQDNIIVLPEYL